MENELVNEQTVPASVDIEVEDQSLGLPVEESAPVEEPKISASDELEHTSRIEAVRRLINAQPKVRIRVPKSEGPQVVIINGARWNVACNVPVEVPQRVAEILRASGRI